MISTSSGLSTKTWLNFLDACVRRALVNVFEMVAPTAANLKEMS